MKVEEDYGYIKIKLEDLIKENEISKNKLAHRAELQRTQLNQYCKAVLARICNALDCKVEDLLEYVPPKNKVSGECFD